MKRVALKLLPDGYGVARLAPSAPIPGWADGPGFVSISRSADELSVVCRQERIPAAEFASRDWRCFMLQGPFAFDETGIVAAVIGPLAEQQIGVFVVSTYDGDHLLVKHADLERTAAALRAAGHRII